MWKTKAEFDFELFDILIFIKYFLSHNYLLAKYLKNCVIPITSLKIFRLNTSKNSTLPVGNSIIC